MDEENLDNAVLIDLFLSAVDAAKPHRVIPYYLPNKPKFRTIIIGIGKASASMAASVEEVWGPCEGIAITRYGHTVPCKGVKVLEAGHPFPDQNSLKATDQIISLLKSLTKDDLVLCLISGGGSALLCKPRQGLRFSEKQGIFADLFSCSASIKEINIVRKHLSEIKAGQLSKIAFPATVMSLIISDVPGDNPADIASGITCGESTSSLDALKILDKYDVKISDKVSRMLKLGSLALYPDNRFLSKTQNIIISTAAKSLKAAKIKAESLGFEVRYLGDHFEGDAQSLGRQFSNMAKDAQKKLNSNDKPIVLLSGGECTVNVVGKGVGGPNSEFSLASAIALDGQEGISVIACDTDGIDGKGSAAGAVVNTETLSKAKKMNVNPDQFLKNSDSHSFFKIIGDQVITGPTLTNVNDFRAFIIRPVNKFIR